MSWTVLHSAHESKHVMEAHRQKRDHAFITILPAPFLGFTSRHDTSLMFPGETAGLGCPAHAISMFPEAGQIACPIPPVPFHMIHMLQLLL